MLGINSGHEHFSQHILQALLSQGQRHVSAPLKLLCFARVASLMMYATGTDAFWAFHTLVTTYA